MSKRAVVDCDMCLARELKEPVSICICVDRTMGPAGSSEDDYESFDLCYVCAAKAFGRIIKRVNLKHEDAQWLAEQIKSAKRSAK